MSSSRLHRMSNPDFGRDQSYHTASHDNVRRVANISDTRHGSKPPKYTSDARISKQSTGYRKRLEFDGMLTNEFETQLNKYTSQLLTNFYSEINDAENDTKNTLEDLLLRFIGCCDILESAENDLLLNFADEELELQDPAGVGKPVRATIDSRIKVYRDHLETQTLELDALWEEWTTIQRDLICLAIEVIGTNAIAKDIEMPDDLAKTVGEAQPAYEQQEKQDETVSERLSQIQKSIEVLNEKSIDESKQHLKDIRIERRKQADAINKAVRVYGFV